MVLIVYAEIRIGRESVRYLLATVITQQPTAFSPLIGHKMPSSMFVFFTQMFNFLQLGLAGICVGKTLKYISFINFKPSLITVLIILIGIVGVAGLEGMKILYLGLN